MSEVKAICRRVILINQGRKTVDASLDEVTRDGRSLEELFAREAAGDAVVPPASSAPAEAAAGGEGAA
jgi:ABC-type Na+ transport system ATPase subunit NatA